MLYEIALQWTETETITSEKDYSEISIFMCDRNRCKMYSSKILLVLIRSKSHSSHKNVLTVSSEITY